MKKSAKSDKIELCEDYVPIRTDSVEFHVPFIPETKMKKTKV